MSFLLDTNLISELRKVGDGKADANVVAWIAAEDAASFFISVITLLELERGVLGIHLHVPDRRNEADALIAATALVHDMALVTRNVADFGGTGVVVIDPWQN